jgi:hypothetical protein
MLDLMPGEEMDDPLATDQVGAEAFRFAPLAPRQRARLARTFLRQVCLITMDSQKLIIIFKILVYTIR